MSRTKQRSEATTAQQGYGSYLHNDGLVSYEAINEDPLQPNYNNSSNSIQAHEERGYHDNESETLLGAKPASSSSLSSSRAAALFRMLLSIVLVLALTVNNVGQGEYAKYYYSKNSFTNYYILGYASNGSMVVCLLFYWLIKFVQRAVASARNQVLDESKQVPLKKMIVMAAILALLQMTQGYLWFVSLDMIPVAVNTSLYQSLAVFGFILSLIVLKEKIQWLKLIAFAITIGGVICLGFSKEVAQTQLSTDVMTATQLPISKFTLGVILVLTSAFICACYEVVFAKYLSDISLTQIFQLQGLMGLVSIVVCWVGIPILHLAKLETLDQLQWTFGVFQFLAITASMSISFYMISMSILALTNPNFVNVAAMLSIPVSALVDYLIYRQQIDTIMIVGLSVIFVGCLCYNIISVYYSLKDADESHKKSSLQKEEESAEEGDTINQKYPQEAPNEEVKHYQQME